MAREEKESESKGPSILFTRATQGFDPLTGEEVPSAADIAKLKERKSKQELRVFLALAVPVGFVIAMCIGLSSNLGNAGFFCCWAVCTLVSGAVLNAMLQSKKQ
jgi:hypothetical protein